MNGDKVIRVSKIAQMAWCQAKALALLRGEFEEAETEDMSEGKFWHDKLGFNNTVSYTKKFGEFVVEGTPDYVDRFFIAELKVTHGSYPVNFLLSQAHLQCNLYCWLTNKPVYVIFVYNLDKKDVQYYFGVYDVFRAQRDLSLVYCLLKGVIAPVPTGQEWKCRMCSYTVCKFRVV